MFKKQNVELKNHKDCGEMIYKKEQNQKCGGSGCGCISSVFSAYFYEELKEKKINKILLVATGALMNVVTSMQNETIPCIAHLVAIEN